jgi:hypothetical protein
VFPGVVDVEFRGHAVHSACPAHENFPAGHVVHAVDCSVENVPAGHVMHVPPDSYVPAAHGTHMGSTSGVRYVPKRQHWSNFL